MGAQEFQNASLAELLRELKAARADVANNDKEHAAKLAKVAAQLTAHGDAIDDICKQLGRPGAELDAGAGADHKHAADYCILKHNYLQPKAGPDDEYAPSSDEISEATAATKGLRKILRFGSTQRLSPLEAKSLSSFNLGSSGWLLPAQWSSRVLSCLDDPTDVSGLVGREVISSGSIRYPIDNVELDMRAAWACEVSCWANNPTPNLAGLGELEIKAESLRYVACATTDLLEDSAVNVEMWMQNKVARAFNNEISRSIICGDGVGKPVGILNPAAGIPVCDVSSASPAGQFTWRDLVMLAFEVPEKWHAGAAYFMNKHTLAQCLTMSDATGRPLLLPTPIVDGAARGSRWSLAGWPLRIVSFMPDCQPGATPVLFGNLHELYQLVLRKGLSMNPETPGYCRLYKFEARVGGAVLCPNAARLLRIG
jgi:HK97 family phage major capsid protein